MRTSGSRVVMASLRVIRSVNSAAARRENVSTRMLSGGDVALGDPLGDRLDQGRGLPGAGTGQHPQPSAAMLDHPELFVGRVDHGVRLHRAAQPESWCGHCGSNHDPIPSRATDSAR